jgi:hypothetical protein
VLGPLAVGADEVLFMDDRVANTLTAADLGLQTITFTSAGASNANYDWPLSAVDYSDRGIAERIGPS